MKPVQKMLQLGIAVSLIGGCATTPQQCDPRNENFFNNTSCLASGSYEQRRWDLEKTLQEEQRRNNAFRDMLAELQAQREQLSRTRYAREPDYRRLDAGWDELQRSLAPQIAENKRLERRIAQINNDLAESRALASSTDTARKTELIEDLRHDVQMLQQELDAGVY